MLHINTPTIYAAMAPPFPATTCGRELLGATLQVSLLQESGRGISAIDEANSIEVALLLSRVR